MRQTARRRITTGDVVALALVLTAFAAALAWPRLPLGGWRDRGLTMPGAGFALFVLDWTVMCAAMMLPTALPLLRRVGALPADRPAMLVAGCTLGFLAVWAGTGAALRLIAVTALPIAKTAFGDRAPIGIGAIALATGGVYLVSPYALACATACQSPVGFIARHWGRPRGSVRAGLAIGLDYGRSCVGCCWPLMLAMAVFSLHGAAAVLGATLVMLVLKHGHASRALLRGLGAGLAGLALLAACGVLVPSQRGILAQSARLCAPGP